MSRGIVWTCACFVRFFMFVVQFIICPNREAAGIDSEKSNRAGIVSCLLSCVEQSPTTLALISSCGCVSSIEPSVNSKIF